MVRGVPEPLPAGEALLWEGAPAWRSVALRRFHARKIAVYFGVLLAWRAASGRGAEDPLAHFAAGAAVLVPLGVAAVGVALLLGWLVARTTTYALTDRRVVMRVGIALPAVVNVPLPFVDAASTREFPDGTGEIALSLRRDHRFAWLLLWPHVRPWCFREPEPALIGVPQVAAVGERLRRELTASAAAGQAETAQPVDAAPAAWQRDARPGIAVVPDREQLASTG